MKKILLCLTFLALPGLWFGYGAYLSATMPQVEWRETTSLQVRGEKTLPFYELMSPLPTLEGNHVVPRLEYKKGPPDRFIEKISLLVQGAPNAPKERIVYYGRRTREDLPLTIFPETGAGREARFLLAALELSQKGVLPAYAQSSFSFLWKPLYLREASRQLRGVRSVTVMDQASTPAFLFEYNSLEGAKSSALFSRRNSFYKIDFLADKNFRALNPLELFRKSFLIERRADAMDFLARNLSEVRLEQKGLRSLGLREVAWPILLLAANVSVDPSSVDAFFHFAGISALLYRSSGVDEADLETLDVLRNNVLASEFYARDVKPESRQTAEISRLVRLLTRNLEQ
jgi:hypothetical protein